MSAAPKTAMVLAAGLGTRMRPLTLAKPKPLIDVGGKALIDHMLDRLAEAGVQRAIVNVHYLPELVVAHLTGRTRPEIVISDERARLMDSGGALVQALHLLGDAPIFCVNTDQVWLEDGASALGALIEAWDESRMDALLLLAKRETSLGFEGSGDFFQTPNGALARRGAAATAPWIYAGVQIIRPQLFRNRPLEPFSLNRVWDDAIGAGRLFGAPLDGLWMHVGDPGAREQAAARLAAQPATIR